MKKTLFILLLLASFSSQAQTNRFPSTDSLKKYILRYIRNSTMEAFTNLRMQNVVYGTVQILDSLTANGSGVDSIWASSSSTKDTIKYSVGGTDYVAAVLDKASLRLLLTDTLAMLSGYTRLQRFNDSLAAHDAKIEGKLSNITGLVTSGTNVTVTGSGTSGSPYVVNASGGGSSDSSWVSTETGTQPGTLGTITNINPFGASLPSGWIDNTPEATVTVSGGKIAVSGGNENVITTLGTGISYRNRIEIDSAHNYDKLMYEFSFVPKTKNSVSKLSFTFKPNSEFFSSSTDFFLNLTDNIDSSGLLILKNGITGSLLTSTAKLGFSIGDSLKVKIIRDYWMLYVIYTNKTTNKSVRLTYEYSTGFGTGGKAYFGILGGDQDITSFKVSSWNINNLPDGITLLGDSHTAGAGASSYDKSFASLLSQKNSFRISNISNGSVTLLQMAITHVPNAIRLNNRIVIITAGFNDRRDLGVDTNSFRQRVDSVAQPLIRAGKTVVLSTLVPLFNGTDDKFNTVIINLGNTYGLKVIRIDSVLRRSGTDINIRAGLLSNDNIHLSDSGHYVFASEISRRVEEINAEFVKDTTSHIKFLNLPVGNRNLNVVRIDSKTGEVYQFPEEKFDGIKNVYGSSGGQGTTAQKNSQIHVDKPIRTDSALFANRINFNGSNGGSILQDWYNFEITNAGFAGSGLTPVFSSFGTSKGNFVGSIKNSDLAKQQGASSFANTSQQNFIWSPQNINLSGGFGTNTVLNVLTNLGLSSSASGNLFAGAQGGGNIGNGNYNIGFSSIIDYNGGRANFGASTLTGAIVFGTPYDFNGGEDVINGEVVIASYTRGDRIYNFGPKGGFAGTKIIWKPGYQAGTNLAALPLEIHGMNPTGNGTSGSIVFKTFNSGSSGTTKSTSESTELTINNKRVTVDNRFQTSTGADVASANDLTLGNDGNVFTITGTTTINAITTTNWQAGSEVILIFSGSVTVKNNTSGGGGTSVMLLSGGVDFAATANDVLRLVYNGVSWLEVSRSVN